MTNQSDVVCCAFCVAQIGFWEGDDAFKVHRCWNPNCEVIRGLSVGNIRIGSSDQPTAMSAQPTRTYVVIVLS